MNGEKLVNAIASCLVILGNQLFPLEKLSDLPINTVYMSEDIGLCSHLKFHKHRLMLFLSAMRAHAELLAQAGYQVSYVEITDPIASQPYEQRLVEFLHRQAIATVYVFEIEDEPFATRFKSALQEAQIVLKILPSPLFLCSRSDFQLYSHGQLD